MNDRFHTATRIYHMRGDVEDYSIPFFVNTIGETVQGQKFENGFIHGRNDYYVMCLTSGSLDMKVGDKRCTLTAGKCIIMSPHTYVWYNNYESEDTLRYYTVHVTGYEAKQIFENCGLRIGEVLDVRITRDITEQFERILSLFPAIRPNFEFSLTVMLQCFFVMLGKNIVLKESSASERIDHSIVYIHKHLSEELSVEELARIEFLSPSRYRTLFKETLGISPIEYISQQRMRLACHLIEHGDLSLSQIAEACGYSDRLYFQRVFKKYIGITPGGYKSKFH